MKTDKNAAGKSVLQSIADNKTDLFLIDSSSYFYRAYYALPPLTNSAGMPTGAALGYTRMLMKLLKEARIKFGACLFDSRRSLRKESYEAYKANRKGMPEELLAQVEFLTDISYFLGFHTFRLEGYEADDLIAYIVRNISDKFSVKTCIVSSDKDLKQLLSENVIMYDALKNKVITNDDFQSAYGIKPEQFSNALALMGDSSDNIPGIKGIGEKTALSLIKKFKSLDGIYENIGEIKQPKLKELLETHRDDAYQSLGLASFYEDVNINQANFIPESAPSYSSSGNLSFEMPDNYLVNEKNTAGLYKIFKKLEFNSLIRDLGLNPHNGSGEYCKTEKQFKDERTGCPDCPADTTVEENLLALYVDFKDKKKSGRGDLLNFEGDGVFPEIYLFSKKTGNLHLGLKDIEDNPLILGILKDKSVKKIGIGLTSVAKFFIESGIEFNGAYFDLSIASYLINPIRHKHSLDNLEKEFGEEPSATGVINQGSVLSGKSENLGSQILELYKILKSRIEEDADLKFLFFNLDMPLAAILSEMEKTGFMVDKNGLLSLSAELGFESEKLAGIIHGIAGREFNINSPKQLSEVMFGEMKFKRVKKNSTDIAVLSSIKSELEVLNGLAGSEDEQIKKYLLFIDSLMSYRNKVKLKSSFTDVLLKEIGNDNRVHTSFSQITTSTGRLASQDPNLQNIPVTGELGLRIRRCFIAKNGYLLLSADYSQIDLRVMASISGDEALIQSFINNEDIHSKTASEIFGVSPAEVDASMRRKAKVINFGIIYGMSPYGLSKELDIPTEEARIYIEKFFTKHPFISEYMDKTVKEARQSGFVRTAFGRKCYVDGFNFRTGTGNISSFAERAAINAPIQGTAADIIKIAMVNIHKSTESGGEFSGLARMILQVHDELIFEVNSNAVGDFSKLVKLTMSDEKLLKKVPLVVNVGVGNNWAEAH